MQNFILRRGSLIATHGYKTFLFSRPSSNFVFNNASSFLVTSQHRDYAKKNKKREKKISAKRKMRLQQEQERKNAQLQYEREKAKFLERMKKEEEKALAKTAAVKKTSGVVAKKKHKVPKPPKKRVIPISSDPLPGERREPEDAFREYMDSKQNVDLEKENVFCFGAPELESLHRFSKYRDEVLSSARQLLEKAEKVNGVEFLDVIDEIEYKFNRLSTLCSVVRELHPSIEFINLAERNQMLLDHFIIDDFVKRSSILNKLHGSYTMMNRLILLELKEDSSLNDEQKRFVDVLITKYTRMGLMEKDGNLYRDLKVDADNSFDTLKNFDLPPVQILHPSRLFELPNEMRKEIPKEKIKKKKYAIVNIAKYLTPILENVTVEPIRKEVYEAAYKYFTSEDSSFNKNLKNALEAADKLAKQRGYESFTEMEIKENGFASPEEIENIFNQLREQIKADQEVANLKQIKEQSKPEYLRTTHPLEGYDIPYFVQRNIHKMRKYEPEAIRQFFPISRCLEGIQRLCKDYFNVDITFEKLAKYETWEPLNVKKLVISENGNTIGTIYLDIFKRKSHKPKEATHFIIQQGYKGNVPSAIISCNFNENLLGYPCTLSHTEFRELLREFGTVMFKILSKSNYFALLNEQNKLIQKIPGYIFERFAFDSTFIQSFAKHYYAHAPIFREYAEELSNLPKYSPIQLLEEIAYGAIDISLFGKQPLSKPVGQFLSDFSRNYTPFDFIPNFEKISSFGGLYHLDLLAQLYASQIYHSLIKGQPELSKIRQALRDAFENGCKEEPKKVIEKLTGSSKLDISYFVKDIK